MCVRVVSAVCLILSVFMIGGRVAGFASWIALCMLTKNTVRNRADNIHGDGVVRAGEFALLGGKDVFVLIGFLFHEVLEDRDGAVFKVICLCKGTVFSIRPAA